MNNFNHWIDPETTMVNGPVNVIRLQGNIHGTDKVIYLFMDYHINVEHQTQCENIFSQDVQKYFVDNFYKLNKENKTYDFFLEIYPTELSNTYQKENKFGESKDKYIEEVVKVFKKIFRYDAEKNKVLRNIFFENIRLHYLDIRDYYKENIYNRISEMVSIAHSFMRNEYISIRAINHIIDLMQMMRNHLKFIVEILSSNSKTNIQKTTIIKDYSEKEIDIQALKYLTNKIKFSYKHSDIKKVMNMLIENSIDNFSETIKDIDETTTIFKKYAHLLESSHRKLTKDPNTSYIYRYELSPSTVNEMIIAIVNKVDSLMDEKFVEFFARFTDIYFLRRFLDKKYITNAIVYSGAMHSHTYIYTLIKYFDFKITHFSYAKIDDPIKLTKEIKLRSLMEIQDLILPEYFKQCSNMSSFPKKFL